MEDRAKEEGRRGGQKQLVEKEKEKNRLLHRLRPLLQGSPPEIQGCGDGRSRAASAEAASSPPAATPPMNLASCCGENYKHSFNL